jgi:phosphatidylinositol glycan class N
VQKVERMMTEYYGDENTMFVFTADHGMTDWGNQ